MEVGVRDHDRQFSDPDLGSRVPPVQDLVREGKTTFRHPPVAVVTMNGNERQFLYFGEGTGHLPCPGVNEHAGIPVPSEGEIGAYMYYFGVSFEC